MTPAQASRLESDYVIAYATATGLVERINALLADLPAPGNDEHPIGWGHVGSLDEINKRLRSVVNFIQGTEQ